MESRPKRPTVKRVILSKIRKQKLLDPRFFLSPSRIDIAAKSIFARAYIEKNSSKWPEKVYKEHIRAFNNFYEDEPLKNSYKNFKDDFVHTIESVMLDDTWKHKAPIKRNKNFLMDGAHRVAASIVLNDKVNAITPNKVYKHTWNYDFFRSQRDHIDAIDDNILDFITIEYVSLKKNNIFVAIIFPSAEEHREQAHEHLLTLGEIVNRKSFKHDEFIGKEVIKQLYYNSTNDQWNNGLDFSGAIRKAGPCFEGTGDLEVYVIEANLDETTRMKEKQYLRSLWNKEKHSIHITDTVDEANRVVRMFFNENSRRFMKVDRQQEFSSQKMQDMFDEYVKIAPKDILEREKIAIEGSAVMDLANIRPARDLDYISRDDKILFNTKDIEKHDIDENRYHIESIDEIITNPKYYFYYKGYKFMDILEIEEYKKNRVKKTNDPKDKNDLKMIEEFCKRNTQYKKLNR